MTPLVHAPSLPPLMLPPADTVEDSLSLCAGGDAPPEIALLQFLAMTRSEEEGERALGDAIWDALENHQAGKAERLGTMQKLWDGARAVVCAAFH